MYPRIRDLRTDRDLNQTQVAKLLGMSQTGYSKYETGENDVPTQVLIRLARFPIRASTICWGKRTNAGDIQSPKHDNAAPRRKALRRGVRCSLSYRGTA